jgi:predicted PolB exonuclease-like 3'-5' exonuclease
MNILVFDIETVPDVESGKKIYDLEGLPDKDVIKAIEHMRNQQTGSDFMPHYMQRIVAISAVLSTHDSVRVWSLGEADSTEKELLQRFYDGLEKYNPTIVSWNGGGFDLPVMHYRSLLHGVNAQHYWQMGDDDTSFRYNNYISRFHWRHIDLMDVLAGFQMRANAKLDHIATMLGFPGKLGMDGSKVANAFMDGNIEDIRNYCETDVLNTYLVFLRFELMRGKIYEKEYGRRCEQVRDYLSESGDEHLLEFLKAWV